MSLFANDPSVLFRTLEFIPNQDMSREQKINAVARTVIVMSLGGFAVTSKPRFLAIGITMLIVIYLMNYKTTRTTEGFHKHKPVSIYKDGTKKNPLSNVLLTQIADDPMRPPAPPAHESEETITKNTKKSVQFMNPEIKNTNKQLYGDLWEKFELDQSNRAFFSTANTEVAADQGAFSQFLYGGMISGKENTVDGAIARTQDNSRYRLY